MTSKIQAVFAVVLASLVVTACGQEKNADEQPEADPVAARQTPADDLTLHHGSAQAALAPALPIKIVSVDAAGDGCPANSISTNISPDAQAFTMIFGEFQVVVEPEGKPQRVVRRCGVSVGLDVPVGWQFAVISLDQRGYADLPQGTRAKLTTEISFSDQRSGRKVRTRLVGPTATDFQISKQVRLAASKWSRCGGQTSLEVDLEAVVRVKKNQGAYLSIDSLDGEFNQTLGLKWQKCK